MKKVKYWVIKTDDIYWMKNDKMTEYQKKAERFSSREEALSYMEVCSSATDCAKIVKVVAKRR